MDTVSRVQIPGACKADRDHDPRPPGLREGWGQGSGDGCPALWPLGVGGKGRDA